MPNWCKGSLKLRGKSDDILRFFKEGLNVYKYKFDEQGNNISEVLDKSTWFKLDDDSLDPEYSHYDIWLNAIELYVEGTNRAFVITDTVDEIVIDKGDNVIAYCEVQQAWGFRVEDWEAISKEYNVDIRLYGIECGFGFEDNIVIIDGKAELAESNNYGSYDGFVWNCPFPWIGG